MTRLRTFRSIAAHASAALLVAASLISATGVSAAQPGWDIQITTLPSAVSPGADAGYRLVISNTGSSNISQLFLTDSITVPPTYLAGQRIELCQTEPVLFCSFGALNAGDSITLTVAYETPTSGSSFSVTFQLNTTGASFKDKGANSHGDTFTTTATTDLDGNENFAGGFIQSADSSVANGQALSRRNVQATKAIVDATSQSGIPVTVEDGTGVSFACLGCGGLTQLGEWSDVQVAEGTTLSGLIEVTITIFWKNVPNNINLNNVIVFHTNDAGTETEIIDTVCGATPVANCLIATTLESKDLQIVVFVDHNGGFKGGLS
ncbi:MAG: hypothetical protein L0221_01305 [Chloroflexi bacterium]|nr:hypothetical protein [Chloroflexota bacterium]